MPPPKNAMEIYQHLDKSNCRDCGEKTCLAFAGSVFTGRRKIKDCPKLDQEIIHRFSGKAAKQKTIEESRYEYLETLKKEGFSCLPVLEKDIWCEVITIYMTQNIGDK